MTTSTLISYICTRAPPAPKRAKTATSTNPDPDETVEKLPDFILRIASDKILRYVIESPHSPPKLKQKAIQAASAKWIRGELRDTELQNYLIVHNDSEKFLRDLLNLPDLPVNIVEKVIQSMNVDFGRLAFAINHAQPRRLRFDNLKDALKYFNDEKIDKKNYQRRVAILRLKYYEMLRRCSSIGSTLLRENNIQTLLFYLYAREFYKKGGQSSTDQQDEVKYTEEELDMFEKAVDTYKQYMRDHLRWRQAFDHDGFFGFK